ncbi:MAG: hypothetical protein ABSG68_05405, partial [Thermoguttaceae bacterium]
MNPDLSLDLAQAADGRETVVLFPGEADADAAASVVLHALRRAVTTREAAASGGRYTTSDVTWHLPAAELSAPPQLADIIRDQDGCRWTVL